jgi:hypothetical protein
VKNDIITTIAAIDTIAEARLAHPARLDNHLAKFPFDIAETDRHELRKLIEYAALPRSETLSNKFSGYRIKPIRHVRSMVG